MERKRLNQMNTPTPTPRTDSEYIQIYNKDVTGCSDACDYVPASVARQLETELAVAIARAEHAEALIRSLCKICSTPIGAASEDSK